MIKRTMIYSMRRGADGKVSEVVGGELFRAGDELEIHARWHSEDGNDRVSVHLAGRGEELEMELTAAQAVILVRALSRELGPWAW